MDDEKFRGLEWLDEAHDAAERVALFPKPETAGAANLVLANLYTLGVGLLHVAKATEVPDARAAPPEPPAPTTTATVAPNELAGTVR